MRTQLKLSIFSKGQHAVRFILLFRLIKDTERWTKYRAFNCDSERETKFSICLRVRNNVLLAINYTIPKPIWTYGIQLWGTASTSNIEILERLQSKALRMIVEATWYVTNTVIWRDLQIPTVKEEIRCYSSQYSARLSAHPNDLIRGTSTK
jgi:hypothetical protein